MYAYRRKGHYPSSTSNSGKWLVFLDETKIDDEWAKVKQATEEGFPGEREGFDCNAKSERSETPFADFEIAKFSEAKKRVEVISQFNSWVPKLNRRVIDDLIRNQCVEVIASHEGPSGLLHSLKIAATQHFCQDMWTSLST